MRNTKKVLHVVGAMNRAGTETMLMNIYRNIDREKLQFDFISYSMEDAHYDEEIRQLGGKVIKLSTPNSVGIKKAIDEMMEVIKNNGPYQAVHAHTLFNSGVAMIAAKQCKINIRIAHAHTTLDNASSIIRKAYINMMRFFINKYATNTLACSREAGKYLFGDNEIRKQKYTYFPNLIGYEELLHPQKKMVEKFRSKVNIGNGIVIGHIGTFKESKNHRFLLEITRYLTEKNINVKLLLVGDGELRGEIENLAKQNNIFDKIIFAGVREDISTMLHTMDVFAFPSIFEGLGLVLLEAQASGLPCIVSESIQPEADLGLNLVTKLKLNEGADVWAKEILKASGSKENNINKIHNAFKEKEYSTSICISKLMNIYNIEYDKKTSLN